MDVHVWDGNKSYSCHTLTPKWEYFVLNVHTFLIISALNNLDAQIYDKY